MGLIFYTSLITSCTSHFLKKKTQPTLYPLYLLFLSLLPPTDPSIPSSLLPAAHPFSSVKGSNYDRGSNWSVLPTTIEVQTLSSSNYPHQVHSNTLHLHSFLFFKMTFLEKGFWNTYSGSNTFLESLFWNIFLLDKPFRNTFPKAKNPFWKAYSGVQVLLSEWAFRKPNIAFWNTPSGISFLTFASEMNVPEKGYSGTPFPKAYSLRKAYSRIYLLLPERPF